MKPRYYPYDDGAYGPRERIRDPDLCCDWLDHNPGPCPCGEHPPSRIHPHGADVPDAPIPVSAFACRACDTPWMTEDEADRCCKGSAA